MFFVSRASWLVFMGQEAHAPTGYQRPFPGKVPRSGTPPILFANGATTFDWPVPTRLSIIKAMRKVYIGLASAAMLAIFAAHAVADGFDAAKRKAQAGKDSKDNPRQGMTIALQKILRQGMSREEVVALLGPPDIAKHLPRSGMITSTNWDREATESTWSILTSSSMKAASSFAIITRRGDWGRCQCQWSVPV
jgi:hypothetical protein